MFINHLIIESLIIFVRFFCIGIVKKRVKAIARAYRLGQRCDVTAHYIVSNLAFEQLILKKQIAKTALSKEYMNGSEYLEPKLKTDSLSYFEMLDMIQMKM